MVTTTRDAKHELKERVRRSLPTVTLEQIRIASPCKASWDAMAGDDKTRHCGQCDKDVHDLSAMTRAEAEALVTGGQAGRMCVKMWVRPDGTVLTADCPVGLAKVRRSLRRVGAFFGALLGSLGGLVGCYPEERMGDVALPPGGSPTATEGGQPPAATEGEPGGSEVAPIQTTTGEVAPIDSAQEPRPDVPHETMGRMYIAPEGR